MPKIAIYSICKNEEHNIDRWYESVKEADAIFVLDTGTDEVLLKDSKLTKLSENTNFFLHSAVFQPFRFDFARNFILNQIPHDYEYRVTVDMDEVLDATWYSMLEDYISRHPDSTSFNFRVVNNGFTYNRNSVSKLNTHVWRYPVHEILVPVEDSHYNDVSTDINVTHKPDGKVREYLPLLELSCREINDARSHYYYARELLYSGHYKKAVEIGKKAYFMEPNYVLRSEICYFIAKALELNDDDPLYWYIRCYSEAPNIRESWFNAVEYYYDRKEYYSAIGCLENMLNVSDSVNVTAIRNESLYKEYPYLKLALCFKAVDDKAMSEKYIKDAFTINPESMAVAENLISICNIPLTTKNGTEQC